jgi:hypothetical protein
MGHPPVEDAMDVRSTTPRFLEEGRESGQLKSVAGQFLDRDIDEVVQVVLRQRRIAYGRPDERSGPSNGRVVEHVLG